MTNPINPINPINPFLNMPTIRKAITVLTVSAIAVVLFYFLYMRPHYRVPILMYHSISDNSDSTLSVTPKNFKKQMDFLSQNGYSVIRLDDLVDSLKQVKKLPPKPVVITFDDGFKDNYTYAFPVLAKHSMPATIFLITGYVAKKKGYLNWDEVRVMADSDIDFGGHTKSHAYLPKIKDRQTLLSEIKSCRDDIMREGGGKAKYFCYPLGGFNDKVKKAVENAGYSGACTTNRGFDTTGNDVYELKRVKVTNSDMTKPFHFRAKLSGYYNLFRSVKRGY